MDFKENYRHLKEMILNYLEGKLLMPFEEIEDITRLIFEKGLYGTLDELAVPKMKNKKES